MTDETKRTEIVQRFSWWARLQHLAIILLFAVLLITGLPQKWPSLDASQWTIDALGGVFVARWIHRITGIVFSVLTFVHLAIAVAGVAAGKWKPTMLLSRQDFRDTVDNLRYYLGRREEPPQFGRYDYRQKFEYWGLIFGSLIMVVSGFILYFPIVVSRLLPADLIPAAKEAHTNEALFAFLTILVWHLYGAHLNPDVFPFDTSIFTGKIEKHRLRHEHPLEYEELFPEEAAGVGEIDAGEETA
ncbi:MAG: cytochrome b/b6 domain-containing protein [Acidobacteriota bacterium]|jgi:formate dehydrogenase gamma subunit